MSTSGFDAFISYRRSDGAAVARWLRRELQSFRMPRPLRATYGKPLKVYLDTAYERGTSDFYENTIRPALLASRWLIVVATPDARLRPKNSEDWIQREVADFSMGPNGRNVVAVRGAGEFSDPLPADVIERFPRIEIVDLRGARRFSFLNPIRAARLSQEKLKLVAALHDLSAADVPLLRQEEERNQQTRLGATMGASLGVLTAISGLSVFAIYQQMRAYEALQESMFATGSMVLQSAGIDQGASDGIDRTRRLLIVQGCSLLDKLSDSSGQLPQIAEFVQCRLERARAREQLGEYDLALATYQDAIAAAKAREAETARTEPGERLLEARLALAEYHERRKDGAAALDTLGDMAADAKRLQERNPRHTAFIVEEAEALGRRGDAQTARKEHKAALDDYLGAAAAVERAIASGAGEEETSRRAWQTRLLRLSGEQQRLLGAKADAVATMRRGLTVADGIPEAVRTPIQLQEKAVMYTYIVEMEAQLGNATAAAAARAEAMTIVDKVIASDQTDLELKDKAKQLKEWLQEGRNG